MYDVYWTIYKGGNSLEKLQIIKLIEYYDKQFWGYKINETNWNYNGLILDSYFENSVLCVDYLDIQDYFDSQGFSYNETELLAKQYGDIDEEKALKLIQAILNIIKFSKYDERQSEEILSKSIKFLQRYEVKIIIDSMNQIMLKKDNTIGEGAYCKVSSHKKGQVKKQLKTVYQADKKLIKRLGYEFDNTQKLQECPNIIRVFDYDREENFYIMEEAECSLFDYIKAEVAISKNRQMKIIFDILSGIQYAHHLDIIHRDLHLGNILKVKDDFVISDFGWSKDLSIARSLKSSDTEKNNHYFMDPFAAGDLTQMDKQTDIYSIGKIIEYVSSLNSSKETNLDFIVAKCTARQRSNRYRTIDDIIDDIKSIVDEENLVEEKKIIDANIKAGIHNAKESSYILKLLSKDELCNYIVKNKLHNFSAIIMKHGPVEQLKIMGAIDEGYAESTGYGGFQNYDIYADISYKMYINSKDKSIKKIAKNILEGCAQIRWDADKLLKQIEAL